MRPRKTAFEFDRHILTPEASLRRIGHYWNRVRRSWVASIHDHLRQRSLASTGRRYGDGASAWSSLILSAELKRDESSELVHARSCSNGPDVADHRCAVASRVDQNGTSVATSNPTRNQSKAGCSCWWVTDTTLRWSSVRPLHQL